MDYEALLRKYIRHVFECEGVEYIQNGSQMTSDVRFSADEWAALERLDRESRDLQPDASIMDAKPGY